MTTTYRSDLIRFVTPPNGKSLSRSKTGPFRVPGIRDNHMCHESSRMPRIITSQIRAIFSLIEWGGHGVVRSAGRVDCG